MYWPANAITRCGYEMRSRGGRFAFALESDCSNPAFLQYGGLDVSPKETSICVIDEAGKMCGAAAAQCLRRGAIIKGAEQVKAPERGTVAGKAKAYSYVRFSTPDQ